MGSQCSFQLEPEKEDLWTLASNSTFQFDNNSGLIFIHHNLSHFLLQTNFCKSPWLKIHAHLLALIVWFYSVFIIVGALGNGMVCYAVLANKHMRTPRNLLILNLAFSDLSLCLFTQPFNLLRIATNAWRLGSFMCKLVPTTSAFNVYLSTFSIIAIALDRFRLIVRPTDRDFLVQPIWIVAVFASIWFVAFVFASPMIAFNRLQHFRLPRWFCFQEVCSEASEYLFYRSAYSIVTMLIQYIFPILVLSIAHVRIIKRLQSRIKSQCNRQQQQQQQTYRQPQSNTQQSNSQHTTVPEEQKKYSSTATALKTSLDENNIVLDQHSNENNLNYLEVETVTSPLSSPSPMKQVQLQAPSMPSPRTSMRASICSVAPSENFKNCQDIRSVEEGRDGKKEEEEKDGSKKESNRRLWRFSSLKRKSTTGVKTCQRKLSREKRINRLLLSIALVFAASWMPLTLFNIASDIVPGTIEELDPKSLFNALCHLLVLVSACVNPVLYGWLNENFQREFRRLLCRKPVARNSFEHSLTTMNAR